MKTSKRVMAMMLSVVMAFSNIPYTSLGMTAAAEEYDDAYWDDLGANDSWDDTGADESWDDSQDGENWDELQAQAEAEEAARQEAEEAARLAEEEAARQQSEAEEAARLQSEAEEAARLQSESEEAARRESEEAARLESEWEETLRQESEAEEKAQAQSEAEEKARQESEWEELSKEESEPASKDENEWPDSQDETEAETGTENDDQQTEKQTEESITEKNWPAQNFKAENLGFKKRKATIANLGIRGIDWFRAAADEALRESRHFTPSADIRDLARMAEPIVSTGNQTGEGWFLTGEMMELIHGGVHNIVCIQPFGCLPNHIVGKGVIKEIRRSHPEANIVAIDYDPGASEVNQLNRIKLMLSTAVKNLKKIS